MTLPKGTGGNGTTCNNPGNACSQYKGLVGPGASYVSGQPASSFPFLQSVLDKFCSDQEAGYKGKAGASDDPATQPVCAMQQVIVDKLDDQTCAGSSTQGWCYVQGAGAIALNCPEGTIVFTGAEPPPGATTSLQCLESSVGGGGGSSSSSSSSGGGGG